MTKREAEIARIAFNAVVRQAKTLGFGEMLLLKGFFVNGSAFETLPASLKERFLAIGLDVIDDSGVRSAP